MFICLLYVVCNCMYVRIGVYIYKFLIHSRLPTYIHKLTHIHTHKHPHLQSCAHTNAHTLTQIQQICIHVHTNTHTHTHAATVYLKIQIFNFNLQNVFRISLPFSFYCMMRNDLFFKFWCIWEVCKKRSDDEIEKLQFWHILKYSKNIQNKQFSFFFQMHAAIIEQSIQLSQYFGIFQDQTRSSC